MTEGLHGTSWKASRDHNNTIPLLAYIYLYISSVFVALQLNRYVDGMNQVALIGTFAMMPVILMSMVKLVWDYT